MNKNDAMINYLLTCPAIQNDPLFFNFGTVENNAHQASTQADDVVLQKPFIDGSVSMRYTFNLDTFKSVAYNPVIQAVTDENLNDFSEVESIISWIDSNNENRIFPNFGQDCIIEKMQTLSTKPYLMGVDTTVNPPMAVYRITIQIDYIDISKNNWN